MLGLCTVYGANASDAFRFLGQNGMVLSIASFISTEIRMLHALHPIFLVWKLGATDPTLIFVLSLNNIRLNAVITVEVACFNRLAVLV